VAEELPEQEALFDIEGPDEDGCVWACSKDGAHVCVSKPWSKGQGCRSAQPVVGVRGNERRRVNRGIAKRLAITLTIVWVIGVMLYLALTQMERSFEVTNAIYRWCMQRQESTSDIDKCGDQMQRAFAETDTTVFWTDGLAAGLISAFAIWLVIATVYGVTRWVLNGRTPDSQK
jgi:hypothetical protein